MKKIAVIFDGLRFSESTLQYTISLARKGSAHVAGLFLDDFTYNSFNMYQLMRQGATEKEISEFEERDRIKRETLGQYVVASLEQAGLTCSVQHDRNVAIQDVLHESIYTDLIIVDVHETFTQEKKLPPTQFIRDLLVNVQCPVLLIPSEFREIQKVVLLYDGEPSSVYAIKMADYLIPWIKTLPIEVLSVNNMNGDDYLHDSHLMKEFMERHFPAATYKVMHGQPEALIVEQLKEQTTDTLVILGAYRKSPISRWFRSSMADVLMGSLQLPLFIAHNK